MVDRVSDVISNDIEALRAEPSRIPSETLANIASDHSASANMEDTATVIQLAVDHVQGLRGTAPVTNTDLVILVDLLQRDGRGDNLTLDIYKPDFTSFRYSLHDAPGSIAIANVWTTWVVHHVAGLSLPDASRGPLNHFMMVKPKNALKPSGPHSAKRQKHI
ncbi:hypothetical protein DUNSADRAFT_809 [Dunaliella salina]|uniref:Encoded protein n=1 Tax=Dunaliella salina TaxID=3046 RepID=A0ABQ7GXR7_DUNSA|nr:hypothetical protein DUNSADRAFT_809 [Dunaliella salina]|eukprot:KAF5839407.1 hypothetical protein DUNSADRAFT_809 [Dunaliella salina]